MRDSYRPDPDNGNDRDNECSNSKGSANMGFPREDRTECELEEWNECKAIRGGLDRENGEYWSAECDNVNELFIDDDCLGFASLEECKNATSFNNNSEESEYEAIPAPAPIDENETDNSDEFLASGEYFG